MRYVSRSPARHAGCVTVLSGQVNRWKYVASQLGHFPGEADGVIGTRHEGSMARMRRD